MGNIMLGLLPALMWGDSTTNFANNRWKNFKPTNGYVARCTYLFCRYFVYSSASLDMAFNYCFFYLWSCLVVWANYTN